MRVWQRRTIKKPLQGASEGVQCRGSGEWDDVRVTRVRMEHDWKKGSSQEGWWTEEKQKAWSLKGFHATNCTPSTITRLLANVSLMSRRSPIACWVYRLLRVCVCVCLQLRLMAVTAAWRWVEGGRASDRRTAWTVDRRRWTGGAGRLRFKTSLTAAQSFLSFFVFVLNPRNKHIYIYRTSFSYSFVHSCTLLTWGTFFSPLTKQNTWLTKRWMLLIFFFMNRNKRCLKYATLHRCNGSSKLLLQLCAGTADAKEEQICFDPNRQHFMQL